ncbi:MAG TPA: transporter substrate-binding domain-containing protein [Candidatus Sulfotelmatobacter sp.]|nr:transporter substrate-binding domain-containing protein [Candidatus Sulfotelmatobacter sp.]
MRAVKLVVWTLLLLLGAAVVFKPAAASAGTLDEAKKRGKLIVGIKGDFPPFGYVDANGKNLGFDADLAQAFAKALFDDPGKVEFMVVTSGNRIPFLQSGKIDMIVATIQITEERKQVVEFSQPYFLAGGLLLVPKQSTIKGVEDLAGKTVAVIQGATEDQDVGELAPKANRLKFGKVSEAVLAVKGGRADAFAQSDVLILSLAKENPDLKVTGKPFVPRPFAVAVRKGDVETITWVNNQLNKMKTDGTYDRLWKKYFGEFEQFLLKP